MDESAPDKEPTKSRLSWWITFGAIASLFSGTALGVYTFQHQIRDLFDDDTWYLINHFPEGKSLESIGPWIEKFFTFPKTDPVESVEWASFRVLFGLDIPADTDRDAIVHAGGIIKDGTAYTVTQDPSGLVHFGKPPPGTDTSHYYQWGKPAQPPAPPTAEVPPTQPEVKPELVAPTQEVEEKPVTHHPKPKIDYDLAERNLQGISHRYNSGTTSDELVRGMQYGAAHYADGAVTLTQAEALSALQEGTFMKDGVRWEVWESKAYPGTFYITKLPV